MSNVRIVESRSSTWVYHLSSDPTSLVALCGAQTMTSPATLESWGVVTHVGERYCPQCARLGGK
ncbi:hypothetical protein [Nocardia sp. NPDC059691]|uniref:hypothetical protein n=1 Tax=Nocardia sp. NPDC059691 TaxID=3346908 RepID=UPI0036936ABC